MNLEVAKAKAGSHKLDHRGQTYYFCSDQCQEKFRQAPERYLARASQEPAPASQDSGNDKAQSLTAPAKAPEPVPGKTRRGPGGKGAPQPAHGPGDAGSHPGPRLPPGCTRAHRPGHRPQNALPRDDLLFLFRVLQAGLRPGPGGLPGTEACDSQGGNATRGSGDATRTHRADASRSRPGDACWPGPAHGSPWRDPRGSTGDAARRGPGNASGRDAGGASWTLA